MDLVSRFQNNLDKSPRCKILIVTPVNAILNWCNEFLKWHAENDREDWYDYQIFNLRKLVPDTLSNNKKSCNDPEILSNEEKVVMEWDKCSNPSILIIGYDKLRLFCSEKRKNNQKLRKKKLFFTSFSLVLPAIPYSKCL